MTYHCADLFCGGGGTSTGMIEAFKKAGVDYTLIGINHWAVAIETNRMNHDGQYYCASIDGVDPTDVVPGGVLDILWASPECTNHSRAKGGMPRQNQSRCQPEMLLSWIRKLIVKRMYVENVPDFLDWGPLLSKDTVIDGKLYKAGTPDPRKKTLFFRDWIESIKRSGYRVDWQIMNAADYGAATCRERLIVQAVRIGTGERIKWPEPTHAHEPGLFKERQWIPARDIIDWSIKGQSIFNRKTPLKPNTLKRIENGIRKYWKDWAEPFLVLLRGTKPNQLDCTTHRLTEPLFIPQQSGGTVKPVSQPLPTISTAGAISIVQPLIQAYYGSNKECKPVSQPLDTITTIGHFGLVEGQLLKMPDGQMYKLDITFRMLQPHELAAAMSFPKDYRFSGTKTEKIKQIGNAVCPKLSESLIAAAISA